MKRNIFNGIILIGALALGSCSTAKLASNQLNKDDDVYFSNAKAGDAPVYIASAQNNDIPMQNRYNNYNDDDYYYYNSYSSRINRFGYLSPFDYYNDFYDGYAPYPSYYGGYGYSPYGYGGGFNLGLGFGLGNYYGYSPFGYSPFYGYGYSPYNYFGTGYGYGGGFWGVYSAYSGYGGYGGYSGNARPYRGSGAPANAMVSRTTRAIGYNGSYPVNTEYPGRPATVSNGRQAVNSTGYNNSGNNNGRPTRNSAPQVYTPQPQVQSAPASNMGGGSSSGSSGSSAGGGGGSRPVRP